jgi:glycosyltransferase involved in cell wall biosynthesis
MRLAWFSPMPPVRSGIAACSAELVAALRDEHVIEVYVDASSAAGAGQLSSEVMSAHEFVWRHRRHPYDLTVFQLGNSSHHDYAWPYLFHYPGLAVLHDAHLHHARAAALLRTLRADDYRAEFAANHPDESPDGAELAVKGFDNHLYYGWPMTRLVAQASRVTAVHAAGAARRLREEAPGATIETIRLGHGRLVTSDEAARSRARVRAALGLPEDRLVFGVFGGLTPDKRIPQVLDALAYVRAYVPGAHLLLAGPPARHYDVVSDVQARGLAPHVTLTGYIDDEEEMTAHLSACDVSLNLRWPTAREMSGPWLRALAAGLPTVIVDLEHLVDVPSLDPRTWRENYVPEPRVPRPEP